MIKPDIRFYELCINSFGEQFDEIYFFDDNMKNIKCLDNTNIKAYQYKSNEEIFSILSKMI